MRRIDETGNRYGHLVVRELGPPTKGGQSRWVCLCDCGGTALVVGSDLRRGHATSCGCVRRDALVSSVTSHGHARPGQTHALYWIWQAMHARCRNPNAKGYANYGGRGIRVCERWSGANGFPHFLADMGERPPNPPAWIRQRPYFTLDRLDVDGDYGPTNCRWATWDEQAAHKRRPKSSRFPGVVWDKSTGKWQASAGRNGYIGLFTDELDAARAARPRARSLPRG